MEHSGSATLEHSACTALYTLLYSPVTLHPLNTSTRHHSIPIDPLSPSQSMGDPGDQGCSRQEGEIDKLDSS